MPAASTPAPPDATASKMEPDAKAATRKRASAERKVAHEAMKELAPAALIGRFPFELLETGIEGVVVSGFLPIGSEIDPRPLMLALKEKGAVLTMPCVEAAERPLVFREWAPEDELVSEAFGTRAPAPDKPAHDPYILLVPMLAFDRKGYRLGYGGGFYDRTLAKLRAMKPVVAVGVAYAGQEMEAVPRDALDQPLDLILTETEAFEPCG